jgi:tRNA(fMet)-specific endonuclease VapC
VTVISFEEQMRGWSAFIRKARTEQQEIEGYRRLRAFLEDYKTRTLLDYDADAARRFRDLKRTVRIGTMDLRIAAISLAHAATLLSRNLSDFKKVPGLTVEDWTK